MFIPLDTLLKDEDGQLFKPFADSLAVLKELAGTIGGGEVEHRAEQLALKALAEKYSCTEHFRLYRNQVQDLGMVCGGEVTVYFHYIAAEDSTFLSLVEHALELFRHGEESWLATDITPGGTGTLSLYGRLQGILGSPLPDEVLEQAGPAPKQITAGGNIYYIEPLLRAGIVYIFGGGHVSQALVPALTAVDFRCRVLEDRADFCALSLFPGAEQTLLLQTQEDWAGLSVKEDDYVCIMTRGHKNDLACEAFALRTPARYIGVIGSRKKKPLLSMPDSKRWDLPTATWRGLPPLSDWTSARRLPQRSRSALPPS